MLFVAITSGKLHTVLSIPTLDRKSKKRKYPPLIVLLLIIDNPRNYHAGVTYILATYALTHRYGGSI